MPATHCQVRPTSCFTVRSPLPGFARCSAPAPCPTQTKTSIRPANRTESQQPPFQARQASRPHAWSAVHAGDAVCGSMLGWGSPSRTTRIRPMHHPVQPYIIIASRTSSMARPAVLRRCAHKCHYHCSPYTYLYAALPHLHDRLDGRPNAMLCEIFQSQSDATRLHRYVHTDGGCVGRTLLSFA